MVRVAPNGKRSIRYIGTESLVMFCVQYRGATFTTVDATDGVILNEKVKLQTAFSSLFPCNWLLLLILKKPYLDQMVLMRQIYTFVITLFLKWTHIFYFIIRSFAFYRILLTSLGVLK